MSAPHLHDRHVRVPLELFTDPRLTPIQLRIAGVLYAHADQAGVAWPSRRRISDLTGIPSGRVAQATAGLQRLGWLVKEGMGGRRSATYVLSIPDLGQGDPVLSGSTESVLPASAKGVLAASAESEPQNSSENNFTEQPQPEPVAAPPTTNPIHAGGGQNKSLLEEHTAETPPEASQEVMSTLNRAAPIGDLAPEEECTRNGSTTPQKPAATLEQAQEMEQASSPAPVTIATDHVPGALGEVQRGAPKRALHFPERITDEQRFAMILVLSALSQEEAQILLDELAGRMRLGSVYNPVGYLRGLLQAYGAGLFIPELASVAREARAARARARRARKAAEARMDARLLGIGPPTLGRAREVPTAALEAARAALSA